MIERNDESELEQKFLTPARDNDIKTDVAIVVVSINLLSFSFFNCLNVLTLIYIMASSLINLYEPLFI